MKRPSDEETAKNAELVLRLIDQLGERKTAVRDMWGAVGMEYASAPASTREEYHSCFPGGLMFHSLNVVRNLRDLEKTLAPGRWAISTLIFVGLFHDLGKVGDGQNPFYVPHPSDWHRKQGILYEANPRCIQLPSAERSLYILQSFGIPLSDEEYMAIRLNDGQYLDTNKEFRMREPDLALLTHWADLWSIRQEKSSV